MAHGHSRRSILGEHCSAARGGRTPRRSLEGRTGMTIRVALADDHAIVLEGLRSLLEAEPDLEVVACCADGAAALRAVREHRPDVLVLDLRMPRLDGVEVARRVERDGLA